MPLVASRGLVARARGGDERAFASLCLRSLPDVFDMAVRLVGGAHASVVALAVCDQLFDSLSSIDDDARFHWLALGATRRLALARTEIPLPAQGPDGLASLEFMERDQVAIFDLIARRKLGPDALAVALGVSPQSAAVISRRTPAAVQEQASAWAAARESSWPCPEPSRMAGTAAASPRRAARLSAAHMRDCVSCRQAASAVAVSASYAALPPEEPPAELLAAVDRFVETHWPDRVRESPSARRPATAARAGTAPWRIALLGVTAAIATGIAIAAGAVLMRGTDDTLPALLTPEPPEAGDPPFVAATATPTRPRPPATPTAVRTSIPAPSPSPVAVVPSETAVPTATAGAPTATPTLAPTQTPAPTAAPTATPTATPTPTPTSVACSPRIAANVASVALIPGQESFFYALNQALCDRIPFTVTSSAPWISADAGADVIETGALVPVHLVVNVGSLPGTGEGNFPSTVTLDGGPAGTALVQVSVLRIGVPPAVSGASGACTGAFATFTVFAEDDYGIVSVTLRYANASGAIANVPLFLSSGNLNGGTWTASLAYPAGAQGWAITVVDGAGQSRSTTVTPAGCP